MAVKAICSIVQIRLSSTDLSLFSVTVSWAGIGNGAAGTQGVDDIDPIGAGGTITEQIQTKMRDFLVGSNSVPMGPSDFVLLIPR